MTGWYGFGVPIHLASFGWGLCGLVGESLPQVLVQHGSLLEATTVPGETSFLLGFRGRMSIRRGPTQRFIAARTPATVVTINNITYLEGRGFLPRMPSTPGRVPHSSPGYGIFV